MFEVCPDFPAGCLHGFSTRRGGVSSGRYESLNLGERWGDQPENIRENLRRLSVQAEFSGRRLIRVRQVHGHAVLHAGHLHAESAGDGLYVGRSDLEGAQAQVMLGVMTADCVPILLVDRHCQMIAALHSGWRGTVAGIATAGVKKFVDAGLLRTDLFAAIGPCIEQEAFEVSEELAERFDSAFVRQSEGARPHVDLPAMVRSQLQKAGIPTAQISRVGGCTFAHPDRYYSYRRDGAGIGQQLAFIGFRSTNQ